MIKKLMYWVFLSSFLYSSPIYKSLVLPGWGELSLEENDRGRKFIGTDVLLWLVMFNGKSMSNSYEIDYRAFASEHADVEWQNTDYLFAVDIGYYNALNDYNDEKARQRSLEMEIAPNGEIIREYGHSIYPLNSGFEWQWDSDLNRKKYNDLRISSVNFDKYANFAIAGLILNRIISMVDVMYIEKTGKSSIIQSEIISKGKNNFNIKLNFNF